MKTIELPLKKICLFIMLLLSVSAFSQEIGLQFYTFREQFKKDVPGTLQMISKMGIKEVEGGGSYGLPDAEFKEMLKKNGLKVVSVGADFESLAKDPQKAVDEAKSYGAKYVMCAWIPHAKEFTIDDAKKAVTVF